MTRKHEVEDDEVSPVTDTVPIPTDTQKRRSKYPFDTMNVGDSFSFPKRLATSVRVSISMYRRKFPSHKFVKRNEGGRIRIWRVE